MPKSSLMPTTSTEKEPKGSLNLFPDLWMSKKERKLWDSFTANGKERIKAERVDGMSEEARLAYRLGVDEGLWFVGIPAIEAARKEK